jgi:GTP-binding protein
MEARFIISAARPEQFPDGAQADSLPEVAFLGRSNVGKSSLLNALVKQRDLAFTSSRPGCTQLINFFQIGDAFTFADLPGYGFARVPKHIKDEWKKLIEFYLLRRSPLRLCVLLLDARRGWMEKDLELKEWLEFHQRPMMVVATKVDKLTQREHSGGIAAIRKHYPEGELVPFSAVTGRGVREIWQAIWKIRSSPRVQ